MVELFIIIICLAINGLLSCFEMAFVTASWPELRKRATEGSRAARLLVRLRQDPERTLSVIQIGITLVGIISAAAGGAGAEDALAPLLLSHFSISQNTAEVISIVAVVFPLTLLNVIWGELIPKAIALRSPMLIAVYGVGPIRAIERFFAPLVWLLEKVTKLFLRLLPKNQASSNVDHRASIDIDHLSKQTQQYVFNLIGIEQRFARDSMVSWDKAEVIDDSMSRDAVTGLVINSGHTRLPVIKDGEVIGLLHTKEFIATFATGIDDWRTIVRPILKVHAGERCLRVLKHMQEKKSHMAVVTEDSRPIGVLTFEDIIEEIVGEIFDEDDDGAIRKVLISHAQRRWGR